MKNLNKTQLLLTTLLSGAVFGFGGMTANAQDATVETIDNQAAQAAERADIVVVTGSRIRRPDLDTVFPTTVIGSEVLDRSAFTNIADALVEIPAFGGGIDPNGNQGANIGANFVDFLDLGVQRTLTVVNGRRFVSADVSGTSLSVDFNVIPIALVDRIDIIGVGGAAIYGADAIAGTINVILKDDYEGLEVTALYGQTERGDGDRGQFQIVAGTNSADGRGNVTFSAEYFTQDGLRQLARPEIFSDDQFLSEVPAGTAGFTDIDADGDGDLDGIFRQFNPVGGTGNGQNVQLFTNGGVISPGRLFLPSLGLGSFGGDFFQFADNGDLVNFEAGRGIPGQSAFFAQGGNAFDFFDLAGQIQSPLERINFGSTVKYDINNSITFKADAQIANTKSDELVNQGGFQTFAFDGTPNNDIGGALQLQVSNPFLNAQARDTLINEIGLGPTDTFFLSRFNNDLVDGGARQAESFVWRIAAGLEGEFEVAGRELYWDIHGVAGQSSNDTTNVLLNDIRFLNAIDARRLTQGDVDAIAAVGNNSIGAVGDIVCQVQVDLGVIGVGDRVLTNADFTGIRGVFSGSGVVDQNAEDINACQPLNIFGENNGSPEALDFVVQRSLALSDIEQRIWSANIAGDLLQVPAGWLKFSAGFEARRESALFASGGAREVGLGRGAAVPETGGSFSTKEFSGELYLPLIAPDMDIPLIYNAEIEGSIRQINNNVSGNNINNTVWTVGGSVSPISMLTLRGNRTRSVRSPSLTELFQPIVTTFAFADDPCDARFIDDGPNRVANCAAVGIAQPFTSDIVNATAQGRTGGNPNLLNETANAWTLGAVLQPDFIAGLTIKADYINIEIENLIGTRSVEQNLEACFDAETFNPTSLACSSFTRDASGQIQDFLAGRANSDNAENQFLNFDVAYRFDVGDALALVSGQPGSDWGDLRVRASAFHAIERSQIVDTVTLDSTIGGFGDPRWSGTFDLTYTNDALRVFWRTLWQDRNLFSPSGNNFFADANDNLINSVGGRLMHNASISYDVSALTDSYDKPVIVQLNVDNVFNRTPGRGLREAFGNFGNSEILGRRITLRVRATF
ncbi:MAG: TonB-dependent receptor plug domain-containing protein [Robiginitomaculum sp.]|nr:TonB-dependent receptor plug domain-containing protein [Robiginitomaculum sp.]